MLAVLGEQEEGLADEEKGEGRGADLPNVEMDSSGMHFGDGDDAFHVFVQIKDIVEDAIEDKLDNNHFPFLSGQRQGSNSKQAPTRYILLINLSFGNVFF